jgi:hypothetical protein
MIKLLLAHKYLFGIIVAVGGWLALVPFTGSELATITVSVVTVAGGLFGSLMANRARRYEYNLTREESEIARVRADLAREREDKQRLRTKLEQVEDDNIRLEKENVRVWVNARILKGQLLSNGIVPEVDVDRPWSPRDPR